MRISDWSSDVCSSDLLEASAASELAGNFAGDPDFRVPAIDWRRTARRVLTLERIDGIRIDDVPALKAEGFDPGILLERCARAFFNQAFRDGFFHADLHPGNMFVAPGGPWPGALIPRSEGRRVGEEGVRTGRAGG